MFFENNPVPLSPFYSQWDSLIDLRDDLLEEVIDVWTRIWNVRPWKCCFPWVVFCYKIREKNNGGEDFLSLDLPLKFNARFAAGLSRAGSRLYSLFPILWQVLPGPGAVQIFIKWLKMTLNERQTFKKVSLWFLSPRTVSKCSESSLLSLDFRYFPRLLFHHTDNKIEGCTAQFRISIHIYIYIYHGQILGRAKRPRWSIYW